MTPQQSGRKPHAPHSSAMRPIAASLTAEARSKLAAYLDLLAKWNRVYNLTAIRDRDRMEALHVEDALAVLPWVPEASRKVRLLDIGSGGGIPGIPLAIARPAWDVVLVESNGKKAAFLTQAGLEIGLANVRIAASRIEDFRDASGFDIAICRAFADLATFVDAARGHVVRGGLMIAMKGALPEDEIAALPDDVAVVGMPALDVPGVDAARHLVILRAKGGRA